MKKIFSILLSASLLLGLTVPAFASSSSTDDDALAIVSGIVQQTLGFDSSDMEFHGYKEGYGDSNYWDLNWYGNGSSLSVTADMNGKVMNYDDYSTDYNSGYSSAYDPHFPSINRDEAFPIAESFLKKVLGANETVSFDAYSSYNSYNLIQFSFSGTVELNGLKSPVDFSVSVSADSKKVCSFYRNDLYYSYGDVPSATASVTTAKASELLKAKTNMSLVYLLEKDGKTAKLYYTPGDTCDYAINAKTGEYISYGSSQRRIASGTDLNYDEDGNYVSPTTMDQNTVNATKELLSESALDSAVRKVTQFGLSSSFKLNSAQYYNHNNGSSYTCSLEYEKTISDTSEIQCRFPDLYSEMQEDGEAGSVSINKIVYADAKTGSILNMYSYYTSSYYSYGSLSDEKQLITDDTMKSKAEALLMSVEPDKYSTVKYDDSRSDTQTDFCYSELVNDVLFPQNSMYVSVDAYDGSINEYYVNWTDDVTFDSKDSLVAKDEATSAYLTCFKPELEYIAVPSEDNTIKLDEISDSEDVSYKLVLAYVFDSDQYVVGIDAKTGKALSYAKASGKEKTYDDISGCYGEAQIKRLAEFGIGFNGASFKPTEQLTQKDALTLLLSAKGYSSSEDSLYNKAYNYNMLSKAEKAADKIMTRADFVRMLISATKYAPSASLSGLVSCGFNDDASISSSDYGYVAIAKSLGVIHGDSDGNFNPNTIITRQDAALMLYNFMSR